MLTILQANTQAAADATTTSEPTADPIVYDDAAPTSVTTATPIVYTDAATTQASDDTTADAATTGNYTEGTAYWIANPDYTIWDTPYTATSTAVAKAADYTNTVFKGLDQQANSDGNIYEKITNNDNVTGWIYLPALTSTDPSATTTTTTDTTAKKGVFDTIKDGADKVTGFNTSIKSAVDSTQDLIQEPGSVVTKAITKPLDNITAVNNSISGAIASPFKGVSTVLDAVNGVGKSALTPLTDILSIANSIKSLIA